jgi:hypothetical protein
MNKLKNVNLAEQLKVIADDNYRIKNHVAFSAIYDQIIASARSIAQEGRYEYTLYDNKLEDAELLTQLKRELKAAGFKVEGGLDNETYYIRVSWK